MRKAVWVCLPFTAAVALGRYLLPAEAVWLALLICAVACAAAFLLRDKRRTCLLLAALGAAAGIVSVWAQRHFVIERAEAWIGERAVVSARVVDYPEEYDTGTYVTVRLTQRELPGVKCRLAAYGENTLGTLRPGDEITGEIRFSSASLRGGEEIDTYFAQGIFLRGALVSESELTGRWQFSFLYFPMELCREVIRLCREIFPADVSPFMTALLTGDKSALYQDGGRYYILAEAGMAHIVAVSGVFNLLLGFYIIARKPVNTGFSGSWLRKCTPKLRFT